MVKISISKIGMKFDRTYFFNEILSYYKFVHDLLVK